MSDDIQLVNDDLVDQNRWISGPEQTVQAVSIRLGRFLGEWFLDPASGISWMRYLGTRNYSLVEVTDEIRREILSVDNVLAITKFDATTASDGSVTMDIAISIFDTNTQEPTVLGLQVSGTGRVVVL